MMKRVIVGRFLGMELVVVDTQEEAAQWLRDKGEVKANQSGISKSIKNGSKCYGMNWSYEER